MNSMNKEKTTYRRTSTVVVKWIFRVLSGFAVAVIYYLVFSIFFDTPIEYELKQSARNIEQEYVDLTKRYDTLQKVLGNVVDRDKSVYQILFEANPQDEQDGDAQRRIAFYEGLQHKTNKELGDYFEEQIGQLYQRVSNYNVKVYDRSLLVQEDLFRALTIPAIQPVNNPNLTLLTASFGERIHPFFKTRSQHDGVDYSVPVGTAIFATADGNVKSLQTRGQTSGLTLTLDHGNGYETVYAHLDKIVPRPGQKVNRGDIIAFSGNSGLSFAPHLHYEVRYRGQALDPLNYFFMELDMRQMERLKTISQMGMQSFD